MTNQCELCYFLSATLAPNSPPSSYIIELSIYFSSTDVQRILTQMTPYPYDTVPSEDAISEADSTFAQFRCPSTYLASLETNTTNTGNI